MKKYIVLVFFISFSCGIPYDGETIVTLETEVANTANVPLQNKPLRILATIAEAPSEGINTTTYVNYSNTDGKYKFDFFKPNLPFTIDIAENDPDYLPVSLINLSSENIINHKLIIDKIALFKADELADLNVFLNPVSSDKYIKKIEIIGVSYQNKINFGLFEDPITENTIYKIKKNQSFILKYTVGTTLSNTIETFEENLTIGTNPINFTITF
jgi:hypothetical protein